MLNHLSIKNYALIDQLEIDFKKGLSIITGETGAGKSILLGALSLILGNRADTNVLNNKSQKCIVEGTFNINKYNLQDFFHKNDLDYEERTNLRREIGSNGKSRAFINDTPVNAALLKEIGSRLVDVHSQHQNLLLSDNNFQLNVIDSFAQHSQLLSEYKIQFDSYKKEVAIYNELVNNAEKSKSDLDYLQFQLKQLEEAKLKDGEQEELESELETLTHAEEIKSVLLNTSLLLSEEESSILNRLKEAQNQINKLVKFLPKAEEYHSRIESSYIELKDIANETELLGENIEYDPDRIEFINQRLDLIYNLQQKHKAYSVKELIELQDQLSDKVSGISTSEFQIESLMKKLDAQNKVLTAKAEKISSNRQNVISQIEEYISFQLKQLGIPNALLKIKLERSDSLGYSGIDKIIFLFSANKQGNLQELSKVASGGELSRLMLSLKSLIARSTALPTIIFDEIDTGISGEIADKMGTIMQKMSEDIQIVDITHLPQIASKGNYHYLVYKQDGQNSTFTKIKLLNNNERIIETAKMLSGEELTDAAIDNAKELLKNNSKQF